ncbi:unnamed protein product [Adineta steineri]|nr:unnamed protein product [Adineta steineri]
MNTSLTHVTLCSCFIRDLAKLLRRIPNIQKLDITCVHDYDPIDDSLFDGLANVIPHLIELKLRVFYVPFKEIEYFLRQLPKLIKLTFSSLLIETDLNGSNWERIINGYLPNLKKFSLFIDDTDANIDLDEIIGSFNSLFWQRWPVMIEYYLGAANGKHLMLYTIPIEQNRLPTYLYELQLQTNINTCDLNTDNSCYKKIDKLDFVFHETSLARNLSPKRIYSNLKRLSFSFVSIDPRAYETDNILMDLSQMFSTSELAQIEEIFLYDRIYPTNFVSNLLKLFPNINYLKLSASSLDLSITFSSIDSLTIIVDSSTEYNSTNILRQIASHFPDISTLRFEITNNNDIYILISYCFRKLAYLTLMTVAINESSSPVDRQGFILWFNDYKQLNGLYDDAEVEFNEDNHIFQIAL